jgi:O-acetylserine/cysteine efflux transporter
MKPLHILLMLCTTAVWGFNFVATRIALETFAPEQMAFARAVLTLAILLPWWKPLQRISWQLFAAALAIGTGSFYVLYEAIRITESLTTVAVGTQLMPPLSALLALLLFHEPVSARKWLGIWIATLGAVYLAGATESSLSTAALGLTVVSVLLYSAGSITIGKAKSISVWNMLAWIAAVSLLPLGALTAASGPLFPDPAAMELRHWLAFLFAAVISALMGQAVLFYLYRKYPVSNVAPWVLFVPLFAGLSSVLVYGESLSSSLIVGAAIVVVGVWIQQRGEAGTGKDAPTL